MALGELVVRLSADVARFQSDMGRAAHIAQKAASQIKGAFATIGIGIGVAGIAAFVKSTIDAADRLNDLRTRTGLTGQQLLVLEGAAVRSGVGIEAVSDVASKLSKRLNEAATGTGDAANAFAAMGIKVTNAGGGLKNIDQILREVGEKFSTYEDGANKAALATAALGKGGDKLIPVVEAIRETDERFKRLGITIDEELITAADRFNDTMEDMRSINDVVSRQLLASLLPHLQQAAEAMLEMKKNSDALGIVLNALVLPIKVLATGLITIGSAVAASGEQFVGMYLAKERLFRGDFKGAIDEIAVASGRMTKRLSEGTAVVSKFWQTAETPPEIHGTGRVTRGTRAPAPRIPDLTAAKAGGDALRKLDELQAKLQFDALKEAGQRETQLLDVLHQRNLVSEQEYWTRKVGIAKAAADAETKVLSDLKARQQADVEKLSSRPQSKDYHEAVGKVAETQAKLNKVTLDFGHLANVAYHQAEAAAIAYRRSVEDLDAQIADSTGDTVAAARIRIALQQEEFREKAKKSGDTETTGKLDSLRDSAIYQAEFNESRKQLSEINARLQIDEDRIRNSGLGELQVMGKTDAARQTAVARLKEVVAEMQRIAVLAKDPALVLQADQAAAALENLGARANEVGEKYGAIFKDNFANAFTDFVSGSKSASDAFKDFANNIVKELTRMQSQALATNIWNAMNGKGQAGGGFNMGGYVTDPSTGDVSGSAGGIFGSMLKGILGLESGTDYVPRTGMALLHKGEAVVPANENGRGQVFNVDMRGASVDAVLRLERLVMQVNGSLEHRAVGAMRSAYNKRGVVTPVG